ncbi:hypothetical protein [Streptomyces sp. NPDC056361]
MTGSSKTGRRAFARICGPDRIDALVTDADIAPTPVTRPTGAGVQAITA